MENAWKIKTILSQKISSNSARNSHKIPKKTEGSYDEVQYIGRDTSQICAQTYSYSLYRGRKNTVERFSSTRRELDEIAGRRIHPSGRMEQPRIRRSSENFDSPPRETTMGAEDGSVE